MIVDLYLIEKHSILKIFIFDVIETRFAIWILWYTQFVFDVKKIYHKSNIIRRRKIQFWMRRSIVISSNIDSNFCDTK